MLVLTLTITEGPDAGRVFRVPGDEPQLIGRSGEALPITDTTVSRRHAELTPDFGRWFVRDLASQNHTFLNGRQIDGRMEIREGDEIRVGSTLILVGELAPDDLGDKIELVQDGVLDDVVESRLSVNEDSMVLAEPEPSAAAVEHLRVIYQLTTLTSTLTDRNSLLSDVMDLVFTELKPERGVVVLVDERAPAPMSRPKPPEPEDEIEPARGDDPIPLVGVSDYAEGPELIPAVVRAAETTVPTTEEDEGKMQVSRTILNMAIGEGEGILSTNAQSDPRFASGDSVTRYNIRSAICSPIRFGERTFGAIYIDSSVANYTFTPEQLALMNAIGQHTALAMANAEHTAKQLQNERLAAVGETIASLSHSIKNILQGLRGGADVVEMGLEKDDLKIASGGWAILKRNLDRVAQLSMNMLLFSRERHLEISLTKFSALLEDCAQLLERPCEDRGVALIIDVDPEMPPVPLDAELMHQALMNVLSNAVEAAPSGKGVVTVRVYYHEPGPDKPMLSGPMTELVVLDNGPGIERDKLRWIFEPFNTTKGLKGTGLGLAVTRRILQDHRGRIRVETAPGKGATFRMLIPADLDETMDPSATAPQGQPL